MYCIYAVSISDRIFCFHDYAELLPKKWINPSKRAFLIWNSGSSEQREVSTAHYRKKNCLPYAILCCTMNLHCIIYALHCVRIVYYTVIFPDCTLSTTLFPSFWFLPTLFLGFSSALLFSISIYCGFSPLYYYDALVVFFCTRLCFLPLLWCRNLFLVHSTSFSRCNFISLYRVLLLCKNLTLLICSNLLVLLY
mgnify:CR=1 FL=1